MTHEKRLIRLRRRLRCIARVVLALPRCHLPGDVHIRMRSSTFRVCITVQPRAGRHGDADEVPTTRPLSPVERAMLAALDGGKVLLGKNLARAAGFATYNRESRVIIQNLVNCGAILPVGKRGGYRRGSI